MFGPQRSFPLIWPARVEWFLWIYLCSRVGKKRSSFTNVQRVFKKWPSLKYICPSFGTCSRYTPGQRASRGWKYGTNSHEATSPSKLFFSLPNSASVSLRIKYLSLGNKVMCINQSLALTGKFLKNSWDTDGCHDFPRKQLLSFHECGMKIQGWVSRWMSTRETIMLRTINSSFGWQI